MTMPRYYRGETSIELLVPCSHWERAYGRERGQEYKKYKDKFPSMRQGRGV